LMNSAVTSIYCLFSHKWSTKSNESHVQDWLRSFAP